MRTREPRTQHIGAGVKAIFALAAVAFAGLLVPWWLEDAHANRTIPWRQAWAAILLSLPLLGILLAWIARSDGSAITRGTLGGLLGGLSVIVDAGIALALFNYGVSGDVAVALRIVPVVVLLAPMAALLGCALGCLGGMVVSLIKRHTAARRAQAIDLGSRESPPAPRRPTVRILTWALVAASLVAWYFPISHELRRRRTVFALRASGARVDLQPRQAVAGELGGLWELFAWLGSPEGNWQSEGWLYSLESVWEISLAQDAPDEQLGYVLELPETKHLSLSKTRITDQGLERIIRGLTLFSLGLQHTPISDKGMQHLADPRAASLQDLDLSHTAVTEEGLRHVTKLTALNQLNLRGTRIGDSLESIASLPSLHLLLLDETEIDDAALQPISNLVTLLALGLGRTKITDDGLRHLSALTGLRYLTLDETGVVGHGLKHLAPLQGLESLRMRRVRLSESGLAHLRNLPQLKELDLYGVQFEEQAFKELAHLGQVRSIFLNETNVVDAWLPHLAGLPNARIGIFLVGTQVSHEAIRLMEEKLPRVAFVAGPERRQTP